MYGTSLTPSFFGRLSAWSTRWLFSTNHKTSFRPLTNKPSSKWLNSDPNFKIPYYTRGIKVFGTFTYYCKPLRVFISSFPQSLDDFKSVRLLLLFNKRFNFFFFVVTMNNYYEYINIVNPGYTLTTLNPDLFLVTRLILSPSLSTHYANKKSMETALKYFPFLSDYLKSFHKMSLADRLIYKPSDPERPKAAMRIFCVFHDLTLILCELLGLSRFPNVRWVIRSMFKKTLTSDEKIKYVTYTLLFLYILSLAYHMVFRGVSNPPLGLDCQIPLIPMSTDSSLYLHDFVKQHIADEQRIVEQNISEQSSL